MKRGDSRGLSTVIATLLVILLVIVAVAIVWGVIKSMIQKNSEQISIGQFTIDLEIVSIKQTNEDVSVKVKRNPGEGEIEGLSFVIFDGEDTHVYEETNIILNQLQTKTFVLPYNGTIVSISVYPLFLTSSGKTSLGNLADTYYVKDIGGDSQIVSPNCTPNCLGKECGDDGCFGSCGSCPGQQCILGQCVSIVEPCQPNCSCATTTCEGMSCSDGCDGSCSGLLEPDCTDELGNTIMCGASLNECGDCGECNTGFCDGGICCELGEHNDNGICCGENEHNYEGTCQYDCLLEDCGTRECGPLPEASYCGDSFCGLCNATAGETCNESIGICIVCTPDCEGKTCGDNGCGGDCGDCKEDFNESYNCNYDTSLCEMCTPDCNGGAIQCGNSTNNCGDCGECTGEDTCIDGICVAPEGKLNYGTVYSVWPLSKTHFDSASLPNRTGEPGEDYSAYNYVKFPGSDEQLCLQVWYVTPGIIPYSYGTVQIVAVSTDIKPGDNYEIWETYEGCCKDYYCE